MGMVMAIVVAMMLGWTTMAGAMTREITSGSVFSDGFLNTFVQAPIAGPGFTVRGSALNDTYTGGATFTVPLFLPATIATFPTIITVDGVTCSPTTLRDRR